MMRDYRCKTYIEVDMVIKAKDWLDAHQTCIDSVATTVLVEVYGAEVVSIAYDDCPAWEVEDDTPCDAEPEATARYDDWPGIDDIPW